MVIAVMYIFLSITNNCILITRLFVYFMNLYMLVGNLCCFTDAPQTTTVLCTDVGNLKNKQTNKNRVNCMQRVHEAMLRNPPMPHGTFRVSRIETEKRAGSPVGKG